MRGYGLSKEMEGPFDIATVAEDAADLVDHLNWDTFAVIGHSMGGRQPCGSPRTTSSESVNCSGLRRFGRERSRSMKAPSRFLRELCTIYS